MHRHERGTETLQAGEILVAIALVDLALAAELGLERLHRHAVALLRAVAAAFAHRVVDEHALGGIGKSAALAAPAFLGGAGLVVDQHGKARDHAPLAVYCVE